jgi:hypothetical protein
VYLLELAKELDATMEIQGDDKEVMIHDLLADEIPIFFAPRTSKSKVCELMVGVICSSGHCFQCINPTRCNSRATGVSQLNGSC